MPLLLAESMLSAGLWSVWKPERFVLCPDAPAPALLAAETYHTFRSPLFLLGVNARVLYCGC